MAAPFQTIVFPECSDICVVALPIVSEHHIRTDTSLPEDIIACNVQRQREYVTGRLCAEYAIKTLTGTTGRIHRDNAGVPIWPTDLVGSIAHTSHIACAAVALAAQHQHLGIDIERVISAEYVNDVLSVCSMPDEVKDDRTPMHATLLFSSKEAFYKAYFHRIGSTIDFTDVFVSPVSTPNTLQISSMRTLGQLPAGFSTNVYYRTYHDHVITLSV